jgi:hypothetical protein
MRVDSTWTPHGLYMDSTQVYSVFFTDVTGIFIHLMLVQSTCIVSLMQEMSMAAGLYYCNFSVIFWFLCGLRMAKTQCNVIV